MRRLFFWLLLSCLFTVALPAGAATGRVIKVLPHFLDLKGRRALSPSLYERDAYQAWLREHPAERSGLRFDIQWKARGAADAPLKLRVEARGVVREGRPQQAVLDQQVVFKGWLSQWNSAALTGEDYKSLGEVTAWRVTLWEQDHLLGEQKSFLW
jgi:hypothetical protein